MAGGARKGSSFPSLASICTTYASEQASQKNASEHVRPNRFLDSKPISNRICSRVFALFAMASFTSVASRKAEEHMQAVSVARHQ